MKSPAFQFYPDDFLGSGKVGTMTTEEVGAFMLLLCLDWNENGFVFDLEEQARWCRMSKANFRKVWKRVSRCFEERDGRMYNPRLQLEREKQAEWRRKSVEGGKASAAKRAARVVEPPLVPNANTPSPSPTPVTAKSSLGADAPLASPPTIVLDRPSGSPAVPARKGRTAPTSPPWTAEGAAWWEANVGSMTPGRYGKALTGVVKAHGWDAVFPDMQDWVAKRKADGKPCRLEWYADEASARITSSPPPLWDDVRKCLTPYGERMTRPDRVSA